MGGTLNTYNASLSDELANFLTQVSDWNAVGSDLQDTLRDFAAAHEQG